MTQRKSKSRDELALQYLDHLLFDPYPMQEEALLAWFEEEEGVMVCAPTGTGKTIIAEAAMFEALSTGSVAYYTTPLIALTDQKFQEMQKAAMRWGFSENDVGLVTGNRCINPDAKVKVVVAEILLNRLLHPSAFDFSDVSAVVMDEFHSFNDYERGIVWELSLGLLPKHVRLLLLSATVGNAVVFLQWLRNSHGRKVRLIQSQDRRVPLEFVWVPEMLLSEQLEEMVQGDDSTRRTPALVFCFNREECWSVAEQLKGKKLVDAERKKQLQTEIEKHDWSLGGGPKLKQVLMRGVGVHHAGLMPRYRRLVEDLFQKKLLSVAICTETLAAGINLPARSVVFTALMKGPPGKKRLIEPSSAHQMFGRAGRPQFDDKGYVFALPHEDDVKILRYQDKVNQIPENTKDPHLIKARKKLLKKAPTRRKNQQYWNREQFEKLQSSPPGNLSSRGTLPWRLIAYLLQISPDVSKLKTFIRKRLIDEKVRKGEEKKLTQMLITLEAAGYVKLEPAPPQQNEEEQSQQSAKPSGELKEKPLTSAGLLGQLILEAREETQPKKNSKTETKTEEEPEFQPYSPDFATPQPQLERLLPFRSINPLYGAYLVDLFGEADSVERIQALESVLEFPTSLLKHVRVPRFEDLPPGNLAVTKLDVELVQRGLVTSEQLKPREDDWNLTWEEKWVPTFAEKIRLLFDADFPGVYNLRTRPVWVAAELLNQGGDFNKYVTSKNLTKQEGIIFRHLLRLVLLCGEFAQVCPAGYDEAAWQSEFQELANRLTASCRGIDPSSTNKIIESAQQKVDVVKAEGL